MWKIMWTSLKTKCELHVLGKTIRRVNMSRLLNHNGNSMVTFAICLPVTLFLVLGAIDVFLYIRAAAVVQRAASEAARAIHTALPGEVGAYQPNTFNTVTGKELLYSNDNNSIFYTRADDVTDYSSIGDGEKVVTQPFLFSKADTGMGFDTGTQNPGIQYLPLVSVFTCLAPRHERDIHKSTACGASVTEPDRRGFLTYALPTKLDFDGDGVEDITFFYANASADYWTILSSSGALFRHSLSFDMGISEVFENANWLPCPGDYDGDGFTDFCAMRARSWGVISINLRLSSRGYVLDELSVTTGSGDTILAIPMPGRWDTGNANDASLDRFAVVVMETDDPDEKYALYIWDAMVSTIGNPSGSAPSISNTPTDSFGNTASKTADKPTPGRCARPAFADWDGDGFTDIGWLDWSCGNPIAHIAGNGLGKSTAGPAKETPLAPWRLHYPSAWSDNTNKINAGLYVVERNTHRVGLITTGNNYIVDGDVDEEFIVIAGGDPDEGSLDFTFANSHPDKEGSPNRGVGEGGTQWDDSCDWPACPTSPGVGCYPEGGIDASADSGITPASSSLLKQPMDVASLGAVGDPLFIADFGNRRVRMIMPASGSDFVVGNVNETITTIAGGTIMDGVDCDDDASADGDGVEQAKSWGYWGVDSTHPTCVQVSPLSLAIAKDSTNNGGPQVLFVGDEQGVVWAIYQGSDNTWGTSDDSIEIIIGQFRKYSWAAPTNAEIYSGIDYDEYKAYDTIIAHPMALSVEYEDNSSGHIAALYVATSTTNLPYPCDPHPSCWICNAQIATTLIKTGGVMRIDPTLNGFQAGVDNRDERFMHYAGRWVDVNSAAYQTGFGGNENLRYGNSPIADIRNPMDLAIATKPLPGNNATAPTGELLITSWFINNVNTGGENALLQAYNYGEIFPKLRWINHPSHNWSGWGTLSDENYRFADFSRALPISTVPVEPSGGVAYSPDSRYAYFSNTRRGEIFMVYLDKDGDFLRDYIYEGTGELDIDSDGDGRDNLDDSSEVLDPYQPESTATTPIKVRETWDNAVVWAKATSGQMDANGDSVDRIEWLLQEFLARRTFPGSIAPETVIDATYKILRDDLSSWGESEGTTVIIPAPLGSLQASDYQYTRNNPAVTLSTEMNGSNPRLSPIIMSGPNPNNREIKNISGYVQCFSDWSYNEIAGSPSVPTGTDPCTGSLPYASGDARTVAMRRVWPARWTGHFHPYPEGSFMTFLDADGYQGRNPVVIGTEQDVEEPLLVHLGNLTGSSIDCSDPYGYPGQYAVSALNNRIAALHDKFGASGSNVLPLGYPQTPQIQCNTGAFFTTASTPHLSIMVDYHAEPTTIHSATEVDTVAIEGNRAIYQVTYGPIAETAYQIIDHSLGLNDRESTDNPKDADVVVTLTTSAEGFPVATVQVSYVHRFLGVLSRIYGEPTITLTKTEKRVAYNMAENWDAP
jgi:hypothetical protein